MRKAKEPNAVQGQLSDGIMPLANLTLELEISAEKAKEYPKDPDASE